MIKRYLLLLLLAITVISAQSATYDVALEERKLTEELRASKTQEDSLRILYNLTVLVPRKDKIEYSRQLYDLGVRMKRDDVRLDVLRQVGQLINSKWEHGKEAYQKLNEEVARIPQSREQEETALFLRMRQLAFEARHSGKKDRDAKMTQLLSQENDVNKMPVNYRVLRLFTIVEYLTHAGMHGNLLNEYVDLLTERMEQADFNLYALNNILLTETANIQSAGGNTAAAVAADKKLLEVVKGLEEKYHKMGRRYRSYNPNYYIIYRRLLSNYPSLTPEEIEYFHSRIMEITAIDDDARESEKETRLAELYYSMAKKDYARALPIIRERLKVEKSPARRNRLITWLNEAAKNIGDKDTQIEALTLFNRMLQQRDSTAESTRYAELEIRTRVNELMADKEMLQTEKDREELESLRRMMSFVMVTWVVFAVLLVIMLVMWARYKMTSVRVRSFVENLIQERDYLKESLYHDYHTKDSEKVTSLQPDLKVIRKRSRGKSVTKMFEYIINDMLYIASIGKTARARYVRPINVCNLIDDEANRARGLSHNTPAIEVSCPSGNLEIRSDKECLEYVLRHLFFAADRVNEGGVLRVEVRDDKENGRVQFIFNNTSVVVPEGNEEVMFDNFVVMSKVRERDDCGLFLSRLSGFLIDSSIRLDKRCKEGSCYVLSVSKILGR